MSIFAVVLSATSFFHNDLLRVDDLKLVIDGHPDLGYDGKLLSITIPDAFRITFTNSGNRTEVITSIALETEQMDKLDNIECARGTDNIRYG